MSHMKIYDSNLTGTSAAQSGRTHESVKIGRDQSTRSTGSRPGEGSDRVEISSTLGRLSRALDTSSTERASRTQALAAQYSSGKYSAESKATSRAIVSEVLAAGHE
jgi:hypothetical protein